MLNRSDPLDKPLIFLTGAPRSGTSMVTKIIDAHPQIAMLVENKFGNRRRHWLREEYWSSDTVLRREITKVFRRLTEAIVGNKVCTPDVWYPDDIQKFCNLFASFKIVFVVRDPVDVCLSRFHREDFAAQFNDEARKHMLLDFRTRFLTYASSWRQSIEAYRALRDRYPDRICLLYYDDLCVDEQNSLEILFRFLDLPLDDQVRNWHKIPHHNAQGYLEQDLKYPDRQIAHRSRHDPDEPLPDELVDALRTIEADHHQWQKRRI